MVTGKVFHNIENIHPWDKTSTEINIGEGVVLRNCSSIARYLARTGGGDLMTLYGGDDLEVEMIE